MTDSSAKALGMTANPIVIPKVPIAIGKESVRAKDITFRKITNDKKIRVNPCNPWLKKEL